ncbi:methyl-accepting chemotaxis protein [Curvibacter fontanus]|jgi:methyl-accepting chemotaxis protein
MVSSIFVLMRQFTIRLRMLGAIGVVMVLLLLVGGAGVFGMFRIHQLSAEVIDESLAVVDRVARLRFDMAQVRRYEKDMIIQYEKPEQIRQIRTRWEADMQQIEKSVEGLSASLSEARRPQLQKAADHLKSYRNMFGGITRQLEDSAYETATIANRMSGRAVAEFEEADKLLTQIDERQRADAQASNASRNAVLDQTLIVFAGLVVLSLMVVVPLTLLNMQAICRPVEQARQLAQAIASGDLSQGLQVQGRDEAADLSRALEQMRGGLAAMVGQLREAGESISIASSEIATGNQDLSNRTEQTAGNVQHTVSSIGALSGNVQQTAASAQTASQLVATASQAAQRGGSVVTQAVQSMHSISQSSRKINDIIGVIDGIAFQTNILALNAAVEAARAGEQGRGFAVVASEVRSLAGRSAEAAKEIKALIGASVTAVDGGVRQVEEAGAAMQEIVSGVQRVRDIIGEITVAAASQSSGIGEVNQAVQEIDRMTQQNAALVEQSAAAAESMREQAERLAGIVRQFRLEAQGRGGPLLLA